MDKVDDSNGIGFLDLLEKVQEIIDWLTAHDERAKARELIDYHEQLKSEREAELKARIQFLNPDHICKVKVTPPIEQELKIIRMIEDLEDKVDANSALIEDKWHRVGSLDELKVELKEPPIVSTGVHTATEEDGEKRYYCGGVLVAAGPVPFSWDTTQCPVCHYPWRLPIEQELEAGLQKRSNGRYSVRDQLRTGLSCDTACPMYCTRIYLPKDKYEKWRRVPECEDFPTHFHGIPVYCGGPDIHYCTD